MEALFEFNKIYDRVVEEEDFISVEFLFYQENSRSLVLFSFGVFYMINKGETLNLSGFEELTIPGNSFSVKELSRKNQDVYILLDKGVVKITEVFNTAYGCITNFLVVATQSFLEEIYDQIKDEMKQAIKQEIVDYRFL